VILMLGATIEGRPPTLQIFHKNHFVLYPGMLLITKDRKLQYRDLPGMLMKTRKLTCSYLECC
jgi:hypothetical protein